MAWSAKERKGETRRTAVSKLAELRPSANEFSLETAGQDKPTEESAKDRDLGSGMEMLELAFLLGVVEQTKDDNKNDVMMRKLSFNELLRRQQQKQIDSNALTVYAIDDGNLYGKDIQCEAMRELTKRTTQKSKAGG